MMNIDIIGANGKMGHELIKLIEQNNDFQLCQLISRKSIKQYTDGSVYSKSKIGDVAIDFSHYKMTENYLNLLIENKELPKALIIGTTNLANSTEEKIKELSKKIPILYSANFSAGANIIKMIAGKIAKFLEYDIEILEKHHRSKVDSPSGTAIEIASHIENEQNTVSQNPVKPIPISAMRMGQIYGEHNIYFVNDEEEIIITHRAFNRTVFAKNALDIAKWLVIQKASLYNFQDYLTHKIN